MTQRFAISSLAAETTATLVLPNGQRFRGRWRWEQNRHGRNVRVYYDVSVARRPRRLDWDEVAQLLAGATAMTPAAYWVPAQPIATSRPEKTEAPEPETPAAKHARSAAAGHRLGEAKPSDEAPDTSEPLSLAVVEARLNSALRVLFTLSDSEWRFLNAGSRVAWPHYMPTLDDLKAQAENQSNLDPKPARYKATPRERSAMDEALGWFRALNLDPKSRARMIRAGREPFSPDQKLIVARVKGATFASIAKKRGTSDDTARRAVAAAYARCLAAAEAARQPATAARAAEDVFAAP